MKKKIPTFESDAEAEAFIDSADLSAFDLSGARPMTFEFEKKDARLNMRLPSALMAALKAKAAARGVPYQRLVREALEDAVAGRR